MRTATLANAVRGDPGGFSRSGAHMPKLMTAEEYRAALAALGLTQNAGAKLVGVNPRTGQRWALGDADIPPPAARFLRYLIHIGADPAKVAAILDAIEGVGDAPSEDDTAS